VQGVCCKLVLKNNHPLPVLVIIAVNVDPLSILHASKVQYKRQSNDMVCVVGVQSKQQMKPVINPPSALLLTSHQFYAVTWLALPSMSTPPWMQWAVAAEQQKHST